jgi:hypothetical protein
VANWRLLSAGDRAGPAGACSTAGLGMGYPLVCLHDLPLGV